MRTTKTMIALLSVGLAACSGDAANDDDAAAARDTGSVATDTMGSAPAAAGDAFVDPNSATAEQLGTAGLDSAQVAALIAARPFGTMAGVDSVLALDSARAEQVYARLWMPLDLNSATSEEIELIPGVGARMTHEFEEYRPYRGIEQFRREIGKYVDEAEVARLERYVTIRNP